MAKSPSILPHDGRVVSQNEIHPKAAGSKKETEDTLTWNFEENLMNELFGEVRTGLREPIRNFEAPRIWQMKEPVTSSKLEGNGRGCW